MLIFSKSLTTSTFSDNGFFLNIKEEVADKKSPYCMEQTTQDSQNSDISGQILSAARFVYQNSGFTTLSNSETEKMRWYSHSARAAQTCAVLLCLLGSSWCYPDIYHVRSSKWNTSLLSTRCLYYITLFINKHYCQCCGINTQVLIPMTIVVAFRVLEKRINCTFFHQRV